VKLGFRDAAVSEDVGMYVVTKDRYNICIPEFVGKPLSNFNHNEDNLMEAVERRIFTVSDGAGGFVSCPKAKVGAWDEMYELKEVLVQLAATITNIRKATYDEFIASRPARTKAAYARAVDKAKVGGVQKSHSTIHPFVKNEKVDPTKACRLISPRHKIYNIEAGRYLWVVEKPLYKAMGRVWGDQPGRENTIAKGMTVEQIGSAMREKWDFFDDPVGVGLDAVRFDQHVGVPALKWEHAVYLGCFGEDAFLRKLLHWQLKNKFVVRIDGLRYVFEVQGTRMSGDMNTALGNCLIMSMLVFAWCRHVRIVAKLINNGDDCVVFMERRDLAAFSAGLADWFLAKGFEMKVEPAVDEFEKIEFCQMHPVCVGGQWVMVRNVFTAMTKDTMALGVVDLDGYKRWIHAVGTCGFSLYGDMPIYRSLYQAMIRNGIASNVNKTSLFDNSGMVRLSKVPRVRLEDRQGVLDETRLSFQRAFGVTVWHQRETEELFDAWRGVSPLTHGVIYSGLHHLSYGK